MGICQHSLRLPAGDVVGVCIRGEAHDPPHEAVLPWPGPFDDADEDLETAESWARISWALLPEKEPNGTT